MSLWLILSPPATHSRTVDTAITAAAPCVCLICICSFVITKKGGGAGKQGFLSFFPSLFCSSVNNWTKVRESTQGEREQQKKYRRLSSVPAIKHSLGNYLPVIRPSCFEYQRDSNSQTNSERLTNLCPVKR